MITVKFKGRFPADIREQVKTVFGLVDPSEGTPAAVQATVDEVTGAAGDLNLQTATEQPAPASQPVPKRPRGKARAVDAMTPAAEPAPAQKPNTQNAGDELEPPAFLDRRPAPAPVEAAATTAPTLDQLRESLSKLLATKGNNPKLVFDLIGKYQADGKPCTKASQVAESDRAKLIADIDAELAKKP